MSKIAFLGLGLMGTGMAGRLVQAGFEVAVYNRNPAKATPFASVARVADSPADAAFDADVIISIVSDDDAARALWLGDVGAFKQAKNGAICVESSTVSLKWIRDWSVAAAKAGCACLDAPVTGSKVHAEAGELTFMVGGEMAHLERVQPVLLAMSKGIIHLGPVGSGALFKLINNFVCGVQLASLAEAVAMIDKSNLNRDQAIETLINASPGSPLLKLVAPRMANRDSTPNFIMRLMAKDLAYAIAEADKMGLQLKAGRAALERFSEAVEAGFGDHDISMLHSYIRGKTAPLYETSVQPLHPSLGSP
jgi:3-hydroxyisobutyrate dehydrogenase